MRGSLAAVALLLMLVTGTFGSTPSRADTAFVSIIIDDIGHSLARGERAIALPAPLTFSVLPHAEYSTPLARLAAAAGREVMLHMPMANNSGKAIGPDGLTTGLGHDEFVRLVEAALAKVPGAVGMNNHMGSLLTTRDTEMGWLMEVAKRRGLFFIDSRTTHETVASRVAQDHAVAQASRDVFLDNEPGVEAMDAQFERLVQKAISQGTAIAIAHPHDTTLQYLEARLPTLAERGIRIIPASHTIALRHILAQRSMTETTTD